jgi:hypothetical protein
VSALGVARRTPGKLSSAVGTAELQALKNGDLDGLVLFSPTIDRVVVEGYGYYSPCCNISSTEKLGGVNQILGANTDFLKDRTTVMNFLKAFVEAKDCYRASGGRRAISRTPSARAASPAARQSRAVLRGSIGSIRV